MPKLLVALALVVLLLAITTTAQACTVCRPKVAAAIYAPGYTAHVGLVLLPIALLVGGALLLYFSPTLALWKPTPRSSTARP